MKVVIAAELPLAEDLLALSIEAGHDTTLYLVETLRSAAKAERLAEDAADADVAIECHNESKAAKRRVMELLAPARYIYTSALACSATEAASWVRRPERVVGWVALPPLVYQGTVEVAAALQTDPSALAFAESFWTGLELQVTQVADGPGLVRARVICSLINEAAGALADGVASAADIDTAMKLGTNYPIGPLAWGDMIGLDVVLGVMRGLQEEFGEDRYRPTPLLTRYVLAGRLGSKVGRGFFEYEASLMNDGGLAPAV